MQLIPVLMPFLLCLLLAGLVAVAWRAWPRQPWVAVLTAALLAAAALFLLRNKWLATLAFLAGWLLLSLAGARRRPR